MSIPLRDGLTSQSVDHVLEDLLARFLVNVPDEDLSSIERVFFQVEEAQWFYTDFIRQMNPYLPAMKMKTFAPKFLEKCPLLWKWGDPADAISRFGKYKSTIPVRGVALFNKDLSKVVLVKGTESSTWSFPRGKISKDESDIACAVRETEEETGFNAQSYINENDLVERTIKGKNYKIYLAKNVPEDFDFRPSARNEISKISWVDMKTIQKKTRTNPNNYFIVTAILKPMLRWINKNKGVSNDEELMLKAEIKLKELLGLNQQRVNVDAGRELLNVLQGVTKGQNLSTGSSNGNSQNLVNMNVPMHLHNQFQNFYNPTNVPSGFSYQYPPLMMPPFFNQMNLPPNSYPTVPQNGTQGAFSHDGNATLNQNRLPTNSQSDSSAKEILSILNQRPEAKKTDTTQSNNKTQDAASNRSKAQSLLDLFNKSKLKKIDVESDTGKVSNDSSDSILSASRSPQPSNELEESLRGLADSSNQSWANSNTGKKLTVLKRADKSKSEANNQISYRSGGINVNSIYGDHADDDDSNIVHTNKSSVSESASKGLLDILHGGGIRSKEEESKSSVVDEGSNNEISNSITDQLDDFEDFEDFEEFVSPEVKHSKTAYRSFEVDDYEDEEENDISKNENTKSVSSNGDNSSHKTNDTTHAPKNKIRVLKQGESLDSVVREKAYDNSNSNAGKSLMNLLNKNQTPSPVPAENNLLSNYTSIYGGDSSTPQQNSTTKSPVSIESVNEKSFGPPANKAAASILSLLGKKQTDQNNSPSPAVKETDGIKLPTESQSATPQAGRSSARDLLNILKGGI